MCTINLSKTKSVIFEPRKSDCKEFVFSGTCCTVVHIPTLVQHVGVCIHHVALHDGLFDNAREYHVKTSVKQQFAPISNDHA